ncbi:acyl-CoA/acyl-ACP dehydrogenase [Curvibacter sp. HBC61]|uniref:Acyl-CoA/acyl-ACP dehydrogenase n=1 Tax=Curvibacter cyanobacteriorum TaxID=3026422 RepID=A0ABT5N119_9BURK|nr:acyl-CoA dehydrogenase family protein [Curvibacter sp. HBC61]MDD0839825.1 acyl-CoA/acyl-ACP dehydrogenase [Curvibacter sp. HBC61]
MNAPLSWGQTARTLAVEFAARAPQHDRDGSFPFQNFQDLHTAGLLTLAAPQRLGGQGATVGQLVDVVGAVAQGDAATALVLTMQYMQHRGLGRRHTAWPEALAQRLVTESLREVSLINALRVEPELGTPARGGLPATTARRTAEGWRLSGRKIYSTGSPILRWYAVWARTDEAEPRVGTFLVPAGLPGTRIDPTWDHLGLRASGSHDVVFEDVLIEADAAIDLRAPADWARGDPLMQAEMSAFFGALYTGVALSARDWLLRFLHERVPTSLGAPLSSLPRAQELVGGIESLLQVNVRLIGSLVCDLESGLEPSGVDSGIVKSVTTQNAVKAVQEAVALSSNHGLSRRNPLERLLRDVLCGVVHTPQDDSVKIAAGRRALGL